MVVKEYLVEFHEQLQRHLTAVASKSQGSVDLSQAFRVLSNRVVLAGEITDEYFYRMTRTNDPLSQEEVTLRLQYVYPDLLFVGNMSTIEYFFIRYLLFYPHLDAAKKIIARGERRVHLSNLISWTNDVLDDPTYGNLLFNSGTM